MTLLSLVCEVIYIEKSWCSDVQNRHPSVRLFSDARSARTVVEIRGSMSSDILFRRISTKTRNCVPHCSAASHHSSCNAAFVSSRRLRRAMRVLSNSAYHGFLALDKFPNSRLLCVSCNSYSSCITNSPRWNSAAAKCCATPLHTSTLRP